MDKTAEEIYTLYKKRWTIETFYNYFKNKAGYAAIHEEDYINRIVVSSPKSIIERVYVNENRAFDEVII